MSLIPIGEATHSTHEFYRLRADLTHALIQHRGFICVAAEADWPDDPEDIKQWNAAQEDCTHRGIIGPDSRPQPPQRELSLRVFVKDTAVWRLTAFHNTVFQR